MTTATLYPTKDAGTNETSPGTNYGLLDLVTVGGSSPNRKGIAMQFDVSAIPSSAMISSAILSITFDSASALSLPVRRITSTWAEATVTWTAFPTWDSGVSWGTLSTSGPGTVTVDITSLVAGWVAGTFSNFGLYLFSNAATGSGLVCTKERSGTSQDPVLTVTYTTNQAPTAASWVTAAGTYDVAASLPLDWAFNDPDAGDAQGYYALKRDIGGTVRYWRASDSTWQTTEQKNTSTATIVTLASGWGADGDANHLYSVKTWDDEAPSGTEGSYSTTLTITPSAKVNPTLDEPDHGDTIPSASLTAEWSVSQQSEYRVELLNAAGVTTLWDSGWVANTAARAALIDYTLADGTSYKVRLTTKNAEGLTSDSDTNDITVDYTGPATPTHTTTVHLAGGHPSDVDIAITNPAPTGGQPDVVGNRVWRRELDENGDPITTTTNPGGADGTRIATEDTVGENATFRDLKTEHRRRYEYRIEAVGDNDTTTFGAWFGDGDEAAYDDEYGGY